MKVFSIVDNPAPKKTRPNGRPRAAKKQKKMTPKRENLTPDQIRARVKANTSSKLEKARMTKEKLARFEAQKLPDMEDREKNHRGDVGLNDPNDLATHGKLKNVLSMNAFNFSDKEKAALEKILQD